MKFAIINGEKVEATKRAKGLCPSCGSELIAKCGEVKVNHWAHKGSRNCDAWWENETEWHRSWKNNFPKEWQEVIHTNDENGEKHIADVKTQEEYVLEFQHSYLDPEERRSRNAFYPNLVWIVNGARRGTDKKQIDKAVIVSRTLPAEIPIYKVYFPEEYRLLNEWQNSDVPVFFDFQDVDDVDELMLWLLIPQISAGIAYILKFPRAIFIELHKDNRFDETYRRIIRGIHDLLVKNTQDKIATKVNIHPNRLLGLNRNMVYIRRRGRF